MFKVKVLVSVIATFVAAPSFAEKQSIEDEPLYVSIGYGNSEIEQSHVSALIGMSGVSSIRPDNSDSGLRIALGSPINEFMSLEIGYMNAGTFSASGVSDGSGPFSAGDVNANIDITTYDLLLVLNYPLRGRLDLIGKFGLYNSTVEVSGDLSSEASTYSHVAGIGVELKLTDRASVRLDMTEYSKMDMTIPYPGSTFSWHRTISTAVSSANLIYEF